MKALVTGANGFIGKHLVKKLTESGWALSTAFDDVDIVFHLAAKKSGDWMNNIGFTGQTLEDAHKAGVKRFIFASSCAAAEPVSAYGESKRLAEELCFWYRNKLELPVVVLRLFNVYGPGDADSDVAKFIDAIETGVPPKIYGADFVRDYIHVWDVVRAMIAAATVDRCPAKIVDIGTGRATTIRELWNKCKELSGSELEAEFLPSERESNRYCVADYGKFRPDILPLESGLAELIAKKEYAHTAG